MNQFFFPSTTYINRRKTLRQLLGQGRILLIGNNDSSINFKDNWYHFRQDSTFLYYIGINLPGLTAVIDIENEETILFGDNLTIDDIVWTGDQPSLESLAAKTGINKVLPADQLQRYLNSEVHYLPPYRPEHSLKINSWLGESSRYSIPLTKAVVQQRSIKNQEEIDQLHIAATATSQMHRAVIEACRPGMKEHDLVVHLET